MEFILEISSQLPTKEKRHCLICDEVFVVAMNDDDIAMPFIYII